MHLRFFVFGAVALAAPVLAATVSCSSGSNESPGEQFTDKLCATFQPCCGPVGLTMDVQRCKKWSSSQGPAFDADAASACLSAMQQAQGDGTLCAGLPAQCAQVFGPNWGVVPPGGTCSLDTDCDPGDGGERPLCYAAVHWTDGGTTPGTCTQMRRGEAGDGPCLLQQSGGVATGSWPPNAPEVGVVCDEADGVWCNFDAGKCEPFANVGAPCDPAANAPQCGPDATCGDTAPPTCIPRLSAGAKCDPTHPTCGANLYCDPTTSACTGMLALGAACTADLQCPGECSAAGRCASEAQVALCAPN